MGRSLLRLLALIPSRALGALSLAAMACAQCTDRRRFPYPTYFTGGLIDAYSLFISHDLRSAFQQEARRTPHSRLWCLLNTMPLPSRDLA